MRITLTSALSASRQRGVTRITVSRVIDRLEYRPNALARGHKSQRVHLVGMLLPDLCNPFSTDLAALARGYSAQHGQVSPSARSGMPIMAQGGHGRFGYIGMAVKNASRLKLIVRESMVRAA